MSKCVITLFSILSNAICFCLLIIQWTTRQTNVAVVTTRHPAGTYIYIQLHVRSCLILYYSKSALDRRISCDISHLFISGNGVVVSCEANNVFNVHGNNEEDHQKCAVLEAGGDVEKKCERKKQVKFH